MIPWKSLHLMTINYFTIITCNYIKSSNEELNGNQLQFATHQLNLLSNKAIKIEIKIKIKPPVNRVVTLVRVIILFCYISKKNI